MTTTQPSAVAPSPSATLDAAAVLEHLKRLGVTHLIWLPDSESAVLYDLVRRDPNLTLVQVCREGESFGVAAGLFVAGRKPVVLIQSTGFFEAGDSIRGIALWLRLPLLLLIGYRGWQPDRRPEDTAAQYLEPVLDAWQIRHAIMRSTAELDVVTAALAEAEAKSTPVAVLIAAEWS
ncbi:MAG TPA: thiamine pyrophosphate-binding protein [Chloroflexota bacterium]|jgi:sulfopyruvate decarboxylase TPP-binding subunit|nr:thiamine pyrophosphate-binding protein [Chloroflexota bacterium]